MQDKSSLKAEDKKINSSNKGNVDHLKYDKLSSALKQNIQRRKLAAKIKVENEK